MVRPLTPFLRFFVPVFVMALAASAAHAQQQASLSTPPAGFETRAPIGWTDFCDRNPTECRVSALSPEIVTLDARTWREVNRINTQVNREIVSVSDKEHHGVVEYWSYPTDGRGDCEDYVLEKRRRLMQAGLPRQALLITVVRDLKGDGHAVLTLRTDRGDYILDNQEAKIVSWDETGYRYIKRQSERHPNIWLSLGGVETASTVAGMMRK